MTTLSYAWWMMTNEEYQYSNIFEFYRSRMERRKFESGGLDEVRLAQALVIPPPPPFQHTIGDFVERSARGK